jgi:flagellar basal body rod protein FlgB
MLGKKAKKICPHYKLEESQMSENKLREKKTKTKNEHMKEKENSYNQPRPNPKSIYADSKQLSYNKVNIIYEMLIVFAKS